ncbi:hypothetical protein ACIA49_00505 [Kribbella sp. NPDC051587]|uniref:hypothetical protein n=1 Tax=Kribbella sp. NPDC051587 TaxID=3364119 RepID=UPI0037B7393D
MRCTEHAVSHLCPTDLRRVAVRPSPGTSPRREQPMVDVPKTGESRGLIAACTW